MIGDISKWMLYALIFTMFATVMVALGDAFWIIVSGQAGS